MNVFRESFNDVCIFGILGGPLSQGGTVIGAVSWGIPCARGSPDMFARISRLVLKKLNCIQFLTLHFIAKELGLKVLLVENNKNVLRTLNVFLFILNLKII